MDDLGMGAKKYHSHWSKSFRKAGVTSLQITMFMKIK